MFDHRNSGTPEMTWMTFLNNTTPSPLTLDGWQHLVVVSAHPDDETLGAGGLLAAAHRRGIRTSVLVATLGENSHPESSSHRPAQLATRRRAEVFAALEVISPNASLRLLALPDGGLIDRIGHLTAEVSELLQQHPKTLVVSPWARDGHPDHEAIGTATEQAATACGATVLQYPIWAWHWADPSDLTDSLVRFDLEPGDRAAKIHALSKHVSQTEPLSDAPGDEPVVGPVFTEHFTRPYEIFIQPVGAGGANAGVEAARVEAAGVGAAGAGAAGVGAVGEGATGASPEPADSSSLDDQFFDDFYQGKSDPWGFQTRWYEERKRALTLASLPRQRFRNAFEPGCSIGVLTAALAPRCDRLWATDISDLPLRDARRRSADSPWVRFSRRQVPERWPEETFDLIVLSEIGYYCGPVDLGRLVECAVGSLTADGALVACHWRHPVPEYPLSGDDVHRALTSHPGLAVLARHEEEDFLLEVFVRPPAVSVARASGLVG